MLAELDREISTRDSRISEMSEQAAAATRTGDELRQLLATREGTIADLQAEIERMTARIAERDAALSTATESTLSLTQAEQALREALEQRQLHVGQLERELAAAHAATADREQQLDALRLQLATHRSQMETGHTELESERSAARALAGRVADLERELRSTNDARQKAVTELEAEIKVQIAELSARRDHIKTLEQTVADQTEMLRALQNEARTATERATQNESDLRASEDAINRTEQELKQKSQRLEDQVRIVEELQKELGDLRSRLSNREATIEKLEQQIAKSAAMLSSIQESIHRIDRESSELVSTASREAPPVENVVPLLIRLDGDSEVVHVLGRRTTIGRTPDNDLQIDNKLISRHHAVIVWDRHDAVIEDLGSTNGVTVNGKRMLRQSLLDGDTVLIGKTRFRYALKTTTR
jgi:chromosome segregation ATPase